MLEQAILIAVKCHARQSRKHTVGQHRLPYITHPMEVMKTVWAWGAGSPLLLAAAVLHDVLEDSRLIQKDLARIFGNELAGIVRELTHDRKSDGDKGQYLQRFATSSTPALIVKLADRYCNLRDCRFTDPDRFQRYWEKSALLIDIMRQRLPDVARDYGEEVARAIALAYEGLA